MHRPSLVRRQRAATLALLTALLTPLAVAQEGAEQKSKEPVIVVDPPRLELSTGDEVELDVHVEGPDGERIDAEFMFYSRSRRSLEIDSDGKIKALEPGEYSVIVRTRSPEAGEGQDSRQALMRRRLWTEVPVVVKALPVERIEVSVPEKLFSGTAIEVPVRVLDTRGNPRKDPVVTLTSANPAVATFDRYGQLHAHTAGSFVATAECEGVSAEVEFVVLPNPVASLSLDLDAQGVRTGDVVRFTVTAQDAAGARVMDVPVSVAVAAQPDDDLGPPASGQVRRDYEVAGDWRFVAETPGMYTLIASCGGHAAQASLRVEKRTYDARIEMVGQGRVSETHTSDLWVWEGVDGKDYCVTGTWGANGEAIFWDVTDPAHIERIATVVVDARTVNDVKVSEDGKLCVISREGASNRKNGIVLIDVTNPREPEVICEYDEGLTGGVHNVFIYGNHVYALSNGRRYDIIDVSEPGNPYTVGKYELETPGHAIHDVWVVDGLAYSSNWSDGVHIVDVGNGIKGGSPENPVFVGEYAYPSGWNHAAFPYTDEESGRNYVVAGDEAFPYGLNVQDKPTYPRGWMHFIDFTDMDNPREVARYEVPEAGTHNLWIEDGLMYVAYYNGGLRVVDVSGEVMGDLYRQGREIDFFLPDDPEGHIPNAPMAWGPQPHKGHIFFSDWNSGLWAVRLKQEPKE